MIALKEKLKKNQLTIGSWITLADTAIAEIMADAGFDWLTVDMEHSAITLRDAQELIRVIELAGCVPLVRVGENDPNLIKRAMDAGAHGVIVPMINSKADAVKAVNAVKYPPVGTRGVGLARAQGYGFKFEKYKKWVNRQSVVIAQIEHIEAVRNLESIVDTDGIDALMIGPYDLSASIGKPGEFDRPEMISALKKILAISRRHRKPAGFHVVWPDVGELLKKAKEGYKVLAFSFDAMLLANSCRDALSRIKK